MIDSFQHGSIETIMVCQLGPLHLSKLVTASDCVGSPQETPGLVLLARHGIGEAECRRGKGTHPIFTRVALHEGTRLNASRGHLLLHALIRAVQLRLVVHPHHTHGCRAKDGLDDCTGQAHNSAILPKHVSDMAGMSYERWMMHDGSRQLS